MPARLVSLSSRDRACDRDIEGNMQVITTYNSLQTAPLPVAEGSDVFTAFAENAARKTFRSRVSRAFWSGVSSVGLALSLLVAPSTAAMPVQLGVGLARVECPVASVSEALPSTGVPKTSRYFATTGKTVRGAFLGVFNRYGLQSIGYPLSEERQENGLTVQYFERVRMEHHPELAGKGYGVLMTRLGADLSKPNQPFAGAASPAKAGAVFRETNHTLSEPFLSYWKANGGVVRFGYPISEPMQQDGLRVQWFERARFEYHPELARKGQTVQLSLLGRSAYEKVAARIAPAPSSAPVSPASQPSPVKQQAPTGQAKKAVSKQTDLPALSGMESYLLRSINEQRAAAGLSQVQLDAQLIEIARSRSGDMASRNYFSHTTPEGTNFLGMLNGSNYQFRFAGEILARNNYPEAEAASVAMTSYLNSPPHRAIIMDGRYNFVGIGYARSSKDGMHYFAVIFTER